MLCVDNCQLKHVSPCTTAFVASLTCFSVAFVFGICLGFLCFLQEHFKVNIENTGNEQKLIDNYKHVLLNSDFTLSPVGPWTILHAYFSL